MSEYQRRSIRERSAEGQARAVARGAVPWAHVPIGYARTDDGTIEPNPDEAPIAKRVFEMRAEGSTITQIREMLKSHGIQRSHRGVQVMVANRAYLGELHFGKLVNLRAHDPIIDRELWHRAQTMFVPRGPKSSSERLLARLGILRCGSCGARLVTMKVTRQDNYPIYRCPSTSDCEHHVTISAVIAEDVVAGAVREAVADAEGRASLAENALQAVADLERAHADLDGALRAFTAAGLEGESAAVERLAELRRARDSARGRLDRLGQEASRTVRAGKDWGKLSLAGRRELIRATVESATVAPTGRGAERIAVRLLGQ